MTDEVKGRLTASRRERARRTREKIVRAADEEFRAAGYQGATMAAIAKRAGVAVQTVYFVFHTKAELLSNVIDAAVLGPDDPVSPDEAQWYQAMEAEPDPVASLRIFMFGVADTLARAAPLKAIVRAAANVDPEAQRVQAKHEQMRHNAYRHVIENLATKGGLRKDVSLDSGTDILLVLGGDDGYQAFRDRGWPHEQCIEYLSSVLPELLLAPNRC
ncbi:AcrR family transcriptional regulator [Nakamurella sp. UYEF19]|uniref:TetR/AcrR family transcriptional regulator n=1 Tax=Nakamurella sp. UYEF19 TaxID=1756392 RepID=UPI0033967A02